MGEESQKFIAFREQGIENKEQEKSILANIEMHPFILTKFSVQKYYSHQKRFEKKAVGV